MHAESRPRIYFANTAAGFPVRLGYILCQEIDTANVEPDRLDRTFRHLTVVGVNDIGHVDGRAACR